MNVFGTKVEKRTSDRRNQLELSGKWSNHYRVKDHNGCFFFRPAREEIDVGAFFGNAQDIGWDVNFARRIASKIGGVEEIHFDPLSRVVSLRFEQLELP